MRRLLVIVLSLCIFLQITGFFFIYIVNLDIAKRQAHAYLACHKNLKEINLVVKIKNGAQENINLRWENDDEFMYRGLMYDVVKKHIDGDSLYIKCVADEKESVLITKFAELISGKSSNNTANKPTAVLLQYITNFYLPVYRHELVKAQFIGLNFSVYDHDKPVQMSYDILKPPPQFI